MSVFIISSLASHIDTSALSDGTYELIPDSEGGDLEAQVNTGHNLYFKLLPFIVLLTCAFTVLRI